MPPQLLATPPIDAPIAAGPDGDHPGAGATLLAIPARVQIIQICPQRSAASHRKKRRHNGRDARFM